MPVVRRDFALLYDNELTGGSAWCRQPAAAQAVATEQVRPWTAREATRFLQDLALSERLRRCARATRTAPGVDYHRLPQVNTRRPSKT